MMKTNHLPQAAFLDILFEHRNNGYGTYALRRQYPEHLFIALCMGLSFAGVIIIFLSFNRSNQFNNIPYIPVSDTLKVATIPPAKEILPLVAGPPSGPEPMQNIIKDLVPVVVPNYMPIGDSVPTV